MFVLRPDQEQFKADIRAAFRGGSHSVLGVAPTGFGKTVVFSNMAAEAERRGFSVGICAHRAEILDQIGAALSNFGVHFGYLAPGYPANPLASVQVCSIQAMARRLDRYVARPFDFLIPDEAHHAAPGSAYHAVINVHRQKNKRVLGVTATPERLSGEPLSASFDSMVVGPSVSQLMQLGALSHYVAYAPARPDLGGITTRGGDYARGELAEAMDKPTITGDAVAHYLRLARGKRAAVFCTSIEHAAHVAAEFRMAGIRAASLDGKMGRDERRAVVGAFVSGETPVLTSCDIISEGFDLPAIEAIILLRPTQSLGLYLQQVGRGLRTYPGKDRAIILDHAGNIMRHGFPDDPRKWSLEGKEKSRTSGDRAMATCICGKCFAMFRPAPACPHCGTPRMVNGRIVDQVEGELTEVDIESLRAFRERQSRQMEEWACKTLADWQALGKKRGYRWPLQWAQKQFDGRKKAAAKRKEKA